MTTIAFDTLEFTEQLKTSGVPDDQAKGHAKAMAYVLEQVEETRLKELATKKDIAGLKAETIKWMFGVATGQAMFIIAILKLFPSH
ncbi:MAG: CCDC90 family protein [Magnetococcus sp. THC-1_WYH]